MVARSSAVRLNGSASCGCEGRRSPNVADLPLVPMVIIAVELVVLFASVAGDMAIQWWDDPNYSHGYLVPLFSGYVLWRRREGLAADVAEGDWLGLVVLLGGVATLVLRVIGAENLLMRSSLLVILAGLGLFHGGARTFSKVGLPLGVL